MTGTTRRWPRHRRHHTVPTLALVAAALPLVSALCNSASNPCALDGSSSTYTETVTEDFPSSTRRITASGCPNNNPVVVCVGSNPNPAQDSGWDMSIPATPRLNSATYSASLAAAVDMSEVGGHVGITLNGVSVLSCYGGRQYGRCVDFATSASNVEGDTFEYCGGHGHPYHYHGPPTCLLEQMGVNPDGSSPQVGWMVDGFPLMGNRGPGGVLMKRCSQAGADPVYCVDDCGGYYGALATDDFLYRYYLLGPDASSKSNPFSPAATEDFFPFSPLCLVGCGSLSISTTSNRRPSISIPACSAAASAGTSASYVASPTPGVVAPYFANGTVVVENTDGDWCSYSGGATVVTASGTSVCPAPMPPPTPQSSPPPDHGCPFIQLSGMSNNLNADGPYAYAGQQNYRPYYTHLVENLVLFNRNQDNKWYVSTQLNNINSAKWKHGSSNLHPVGLTAWQSRISRNMPWTVQSNSRVGCAPSPPPSPPPPSAPLSTQQQSCLCGGSSTQYATYDDAMQCFGANDVTNLNVMFAGVAQSAAVVAFYTRCGDYDNDGVFRANDLTNMNRYYAGLMGVAAHVATG